ncbi:MAG: hypothetical protein ACE5E3_03055 [Mariprofundus sp.]
MRQNDPNIEMLQLAADGLRPLLDEVVFLGGCAAGLLYYSDSLLNTLNSTQ